MHDSDALRSLLYGMYPVCVGVKHYLILNEGYGEMLHVLFVSEL